MTIYQRMRIGSTAIALLLATGATAQAQNFEVGADLNFLTLAQSEGQATGYGFNLAPEIWANYQTAGGLDIGMRWFWLDATTPDAGSVYERVAMQTIDLTVGKPFEIGSGISASLMGGLRYATYAEYRSPANVLDVPQAYGFMAGVEVNASLSEAFSIYGKGSNAIMYAPEYADGGSSEFNLGFNITEVELGVQFDRPMANGGAFYLRLAGVGKMWNGVSDDDSENMSAFGASLDLGISF